MPTENNNLILTEPAKDFESIKKINEEDVEYWEARELMPLLGYDKWENFKKVIKKAKSACQESRQDIEDHFPGVKKMIKIAKNTIKETVREIDDFYLSRYGCYLVAQNGDSRKQEIAMAQTYFAIQTRKQEIFEQMGDDQKRLYVRKEVREHNNQLFATAQQAGVSNFGKFNNYGYLGLYGLTADGIKERKKIGKDDILDRAGSSELAANLFRITQTDEKINKDEIKGEEKANTTHFDVGQKVRNTIKEIGGTMLEDLKPEDHIKELEKKEKKLINNKEVKKLKD